MPGLPEINFNTWPQWLVFILLVLNLFRSQIGSLMAVAIPTGVQRYFRQRARRQADREEFSQHIGEALVNSHLQRSTEDYYTDVERERWMLEQLGKRDLWIQDVLGKQLDGLSAAAKETNELLQAIVGLLETRLPAPRDSSRK